jgi:hypothetical protein
MKKSLVESYRVGASTDTKLMKHAGQDAEENTLDSQA